MWFHIRSAHFYIPVPFKTEFVKKVLIHVYKMKSVRFAHVAAQDIAIIKLKLKVKDI